MAPLAGRRLGERQHPAARCARVAHARQPAPDIGQHVDDAAAVRLHPLHIALAREQEGAVQVVAHHCIPALQRDIAQPRRVLAAGAIEQAVDAAVRAHHIGHRRLDRHLVADVAGVPGEAGCALGIDGRDFRGGGVELAQRAADERDPRTQACEFVHHAAAEAAAAARDDHGPAVEQAGAKGRAVALGAGQGGRRVARHRHR